MMTSKEANIIEKKISEIDGQIADRQSDYEAVKLLRKEIKIISDITTLQQVKAELQSVLTEVKKESVKK